jgi:hypothetical protein
VRYRSAHPACVSVVTRYSRPPFESFR